MSDSIRALVALGNPGADHASDRHNVGFWLADRLAERWRLSFSPERKFKGELARYGSGDASVWLLKPTTFMNRSGDAAQPLCAFHKIPPESVYWPAVYRSVSDMLGLKGAGRTTPPE